MFSVQICHLLLHQFCHTFRGINRKIRIFRVSDFPLCGKVVVCSRVIQSSCCNDHFRKQHTVHISVYLMLIVIEHTYETVCPIADPFSGSALAAQLYGILCLLKFEANVVIHRVQLLNRFCNPLFDITLCHIFSPSFVLVCVHIQNVFKFVARFLRITLFGNKMFCALQNPLFLIIFCIFFLLSSPYLVMFMTSSVCICRLLENGSGHSQKDFWNLGFVFRRPKSVIRKNKIS